MRFYFIFFHKIEGEQNVVSSHIVHNDVFFECTKYIEINYRIIWYYLLQGSLHY